MSTFCENFNKYMELSGISRKELAEKLHVTVATIGFYATGRSEPKIDTLIAIATALNVSLDELLGYSINKYRQYNALVRAVGYSRIDEREDGSIVIINEFPETDLSPDDVVSFSSKKDFCDYIERIVRLHNKLHDAELKRLLYMGIERKALFDEFNQPGDPLERLDRMQVFDVVAKEYIDLSEKKPAQN